MNPRLRFRVATALVVAATLLFVRCAASPKAAPAPDSNTAIVACGQRFDIGTRVVLWQEPGGYDAYREGKFFADEPPDGKKRYRERSGEPTTLADVQAKVHTFVLHFDVCGTSRQCFKVLQDVRNLSVHFLLDVDGTIYQTLDLRECAQHATYANDFSIGVEIAHPGTFPQPLSADMRRWYEKDDQGWRMKLPGWMTETGIRTPGFVARPDRPDFVTGEIHGKKQYQFDYTPQQYAALAKLCAGVHRALPRIRLEFPTAADGGVLPRKLEEDLLRGFDGIVGHYHVQENKTDPGPAMQWERVMRDARAAGR